MHVPAVLLICLMVSAVPSCSVTQTDGGRSSGVAITEARESRRSDVQVEGGGTISRVLPDDRKGSRHQRLIVRLADGKTLLIQHNIDLASRIEDVSEGDHIAFFGEYVWNEQGGILHWTHHDPSGRHVAGWLRHKGRTYQ